MSALAILQPAPFLQTLLNSLFKNAVSTSLPVPHDVLIPLDPPSYFLGHAAGSPPAANLPLSVFTKVDSGLSIDGVEASGSGSHGKSTRNSSNGDRKPVTQGQSRRRAQNKAA